MSKDASASEQIEVSTEELSQVLDRARSALQPQDYALLERIIQSYVHVWRLLEEKGTTIQRLRNLLFGSKSEKLRHILPQEGQEGVADGSAPGSEAQGAETPEGGGEGDAPAEEKEEKRRRKGHGRNGAAEYTGAEQIHIPHPSLKPGDPCPESGCTGKVYRFEPLVFVRVVGQAPLGAKVYTADRLRCNLCLKLFCACSPKRFGSQKYDETAASMIAILTYGTGMPFNRLDGLQANLGIPLPSSTQWDIVERAAKLVAPSFQELIREAAQGDVLHNDDTPMKILELMRKRKRDADDG
jgi:transposase